MDEGGTKEIHRKYARRAEVKANQKLEEARRAQAEANRRLEELQRADALAEHRTKVARQAQAVQSMQYQQPTAYRQPAPQDPLPKGQYGVPVVTPEQEQRMMQYPFDGES